MEEFRVASAPPTGCVPIALDGPPLDFRYLDKGEFALGVFFTAAVPKDSFAPRFTGFGVSRCVTMNMLHFADPGVTITPETFLAWYTGGESQRLDSVIRKVIQKYREWLGHRTPTLLYGGSAGGCASLVVGLRWMMWVRSRPIPQTDLRYYNRPLVPRWRRVCWPDAAPVLDEALAGIPAVTDVVSAYAAKPGIAVSNRVVILQNTGDANHIDAHFFPLKQALESTGHMRCLLYY